MVERKIGRKKGRRRRRVVFCMGNPWVFLAVPVPIPTRQVWVLAMGHLMVPMGIPVPTLPAGNPQVCPN